MKNLLKNKKGFSLAEILLVVAIIVVLSGATMIGIASMINRSKTAANQLVAKNAAFEADAVQKVNEKKGLVNEEPYETETLATGNTGGNSGAETEATNNNNNNNNTNNNNNNTNTNTGNQTEASETTAESTAASTEGTTKAQGGDTTNPLTSPFSMTSNGSKTIAADPSKKLAKVIIEWENNNQESWGMAYSQFVVTYNNSNGGNYDNKNNTIGGQNKSGTETIDVGVDGCSGINIKYGSGKFTIKSIKYVYE